MLGDWLFMLKGAARRRNLDGRRCVRLTELWLHLPGLTRRFSRRVGKVTATDLPQETLRKKTRRKYET
jgi:hypothetical protein